MRTDLKQRLRRCIGFAQRSLRIAFNVAVGLILSLAVLLAVIAWHAYKPAIAFVVVVTVISITYLKIKYDEMTGSITSISVEEKKEETSRQNLSNHIVDKVVDTLTNLALASVEETIRMVSAAIALIGAFIYLLGSSTLGVFTVFVGILLFTLSCICFSCIRSVVSRTVQSLLSSFIMTRQTPRPNDQTTPLVPGGTS